jgi:hypothetical protein
MIQALASQQPILATAPAVGTDRDLFATISSGLYRFLAITVLLDVKDIPQVGPLQWGRISGGFRDQALSSYVHRTMIGQLPLGGGVTVCGSNEIGTSIMACLRALQQVMI